jgi:hypothetical protein
VNRTKATWFLIAFGVIAVIDGVVEGFSYREWIIIPMSVVFVLLSIRALAEK